MVRYPDTLLVHNSAGVSAQTAGGHFQAATPGTPKEYPCRYEVATGSGYSNPVIVGTDGGKTDYSGKVFLKTPDTLKEGATVTLLLHDGSTIKGTIKRAVTGQFGGNKTLWI